MEQIKGSEETKEKILKASREARSRSDYPHELQLEFYANAACHRYLGNYDHNHDRAHAHVRPNGKRPSGSPLSALTTQPRRSESHPLAPGCAAWCRSRFSLRSLIARHSRFAGLPRTVRNAPDLCPDNVTRTADPSARMSDSSLLESGHLCTAVCSPHSPDNSARLYTAIPSTFYVSHEYLYDTTDCSSTFFAYFTIIFSLFP